MTKAYSCTVFTQQSVRQLLYSIFNLHPTSSSLGFPRAVCDLYSCCFHVVDTSSTVPLCRQGSRPLSPTTTHPPGCPCPAGSQHRQEPMCLHLNCSVPCLPFFPGCFYLLTFFRTTRGTGHTRWKTECCCRDHIQKAWPPGHEKGWLCPCSPPGELFGFSVSFCSSKSG